MLWAMARWEKGRWLLDNLKLRIPIFGPLVKKAILARFSRTLSVLVDSGIGILEALILAGNTSGNKVVEQAAKDCVNWIKDGDSISEAIGKTGTFPEMIRQMVATGEQAGTLAHMLGKAADYYEQQVESTVNTLSSLIEPILIVFLGVVVGSIIVAIFYPIFMLGQAIKAR